MSGIYPSTFYRVSVKAIIRNKKNEILVVKEGSSQWELPGGGMDHGESAHEALQRELYEEARISAPFTEKIIGTESVYIEARSAWLLWLVFEIAIEDGFEFSLGDDADEIAFVNPEILKTSSHRAEQLTYKFTAK